MTRVGPALVFALAMGASVCAGVGADQPLDVVQRARAYVADWQEQLLGSWRRKTTFSISNAASATPRHSA